MTRPASSGGSAHLLRDPLLLVFALGFVVLVLMYAFARPGSWIADTYLPTYSDAPFLGLLVVAFGLQARRSKRRARRFWVLAACAHGAWLLTRVAVFVLPEDLLLTVEFDIAEDLLLAALYLLIVLALEQVPHEDEGPGLPSAQRLRAACFVAFLVGLVAYFAAVPNTLGSSYYDTWVPSMLMFIALDAIVFVRAARLRVASVGTPWHLTYGLFALSALLWLLTDTYEALQYAGVLATDPFGSPIELVWMPSLFVSLAAARAPDWEQPAHRQPILPWATKPTPPRWAAAAPLSLVIFFLSLHVGLHAAGWLEPELRTARDVCALAVVATLVGLTAFYQRRLELESRGLRERQRLLDHEIQLSQRMEAVGRLAGGVAHDFNNSLQLIGLHADLVSAGDGDDGARTSSRAIRAAVEQAKGLTNQLLTLGGERRFEPRAVDLNRIVDAVERIARRAVSQRAELTVSTVGPARVVWADPIQLEHAILNLVLNARDALDGKGTIEVGVETVSDTSDSTRHVLRVRDNGMGMDAETQRRVFEPFFTTKEGAGHGLGLSVVYGIAAECEAEIRLESEPGRGTSFELLFPAHGQPADELEPPPVPRPGPGGETILVVEDEASILLILSQHLRRQGYHVLSADHGESALRIAADPETKIDMLLTDVVMPNMSGPRLAERLRKLRPGLPVAFMSGHAKEELDGISGPLGEAPMLHKPFRAEELDELLASCLGSEVPEAG